MTSFASPRALTAMLLAAGALAPPNLEAAAAPGAEVVVIFNSRMPESRQVATYYAERRQVPTNQLYGFDLPEQEDISRAEFTARLLDPLKKRLEADRVFVFSSAAPRRVIEARVRYAVLCYGVPTRVLKDPSLREPEADSLPAEARRTEASVDSELAALPSGPRYLAGPWPNPAYAATNTAALHPTNGVWLVTRLDGPTAAIARGLVDKAMEAETNGFWGRAYFDWGYGAAHGNTNYLEGDEWISTAAAIATRAGFVTLVDSNAATFPASYPMSQVALYAGWYEQNASGPFLSATFEFMPGAFAYHLHSYSAMSIRQGSNYWVGPLLARGVTATMGCVDEPYLSLTPNVAAFFGALLLGRASFGEAAYYCQNALSWQTIAIGDPLYRPFAIRPDLLHAELERRQSPLAEWSHLRMVGLNRASGATLDEAISYLEAIPLTRRSAVLKERLGDLYWARNNFSDALDTWESALRFNPSPKQRLRLLLTLAERRASFGPDRTALQFYQQLLQEYPDYPDKLDLLQKMLPIARRLERKDVVESCEREIKRLSPAPPAAPTPNR